MSFWINYTGRRTEEYQMPTKKLTANKGASETRHAILREMIILELNKDQWSDKWIKLRAYIKGMAGRASKKAGGLGRK